MFKPTAVFFVASAALLSACECPCNKRDTSSGVSSTTRTQITTSRVQSDSYDPTPGRYYAEHRADVITYPVAASPESRVLSLLHVSNLEEIELGRLAQQQGHSKAVREFAEELIEDHSASDARVMNIARDSGVSILGKDDVKQMMAYEHGYITPSKSTDLAADLRSLSGPEFDRAFAQKMQQCHCDLIRTLQASEPTIQDKNVLELVKKTVATLRDHERDAKKLTS